MEQYLQENKISFKIKNSHGTDRTHFDFQNFSKIREGRWKEFVSKVSLSTSDILKNSAFLPNPKLSPNRVKKKKKGSRGLLISQAHYQHEYWNSLWFISYLIPLLECVQITDAFFLSKE